MTEKFSFIKLFILVNDLLLVSIFSKKIIYKAS